ncbi:MAG: hypothetical protein ACI8Y7_000291 [Candidatus Woesearchaeota archaeon]|jgi:hypothetical protein
MKTNYAVPTVAMTTPLTGGATIDDKAFALHSAALYEPDSAALPQEIAHVRSMFGLRL